MKVKKITYWYDFEYNKYYMTIKYEDDTEENLEIEKSNKIKFFKVMYVSEEEK